MAITEVHDNGDSVSATSCRPHWRWSVCRHCRCGLQGAGGTHLSCYTVRASQRTPPPIWTISRTSTAPLHNRRPNARRGQDAVLGYGRRSGLRRAGSTTVDVDR